MDKDCAEIFAAATAAANEAYSCSEADEKRVNALTAAIAVLQKAQFAAYGALDAKRAADHMAACAPSAAKGIG